MEKLFTGGKLTNKRASAGLFMSGVRIWKEGFIIFSKCQRTALTGGQHGIHRFHLQMTQN